MEGHWNFLGGQGGLKQKQNYIMSYKINLHNLISISWAWLLSLTNFSQTLFGKRVIYKLLKFNTTIGRKRVVGAVYNNLKNVTNLPNQPLNQSVGVLFSAGVKPNHSRPQSLLSRTEPEMLSCLQALARTFLARFQATTNGKITIPAKKESKWKETVDSISKSTHSNLIYEFAFIFNLIRR